MPVFCNNCGRENKDTAKFCSGCGDALKTSSSPSGPLSPGTLLENRYKIVTLIKAGGMGAVYKATDDKLDRLCAVKELLPPYGTPQEQAQAAEWFKREAKLLAKLTHANLPAVYDYFTFNSRCYLVMEFIEGEDLETILQRDGKPGLSEDRVVAWAKQVLTVLDYLHSHKSPIVYRDIKPGNIMLHKDGRSMLVDFGIARVVQEASQTKKTAIGTQGYAPPEQIRGKVEPRSDLYALGATMHHLLTGIEPVGPMMFEPLKKVLPNISDEVDAVVTKALEIKIEDRYVTAKEMLKPLTVQAVTSSVQVASVHQKALGQQNIPQTSTITPKIIKIKQVKPKSIQSSIGSELIFIQGGTFQMGSDIFDSGHTVHFVTVDSFYMGKYPVTNKEYKLFKPIHVIFKKGKWSDPYYPVETVSWYDAVEYCNWLSDKEGLERCYSASGDNIVCNFSKNGYRLPTEAEWEYACRAGTTTFYYWGDEMDGDYCWYDGNSGGQVNKVGQKKPNQFGLYDMSGNVWEWCWDWYDEDYYKNSPSKNPTGPSSGSNRVFRGGSYCEEFCWSQFRGPFWPGYVYFDGFSFRPVRRV